MDAARYESWYDRWYDCWRTIRGVARSLRIYYGNGARRAAMERLYSRFVAPGDLVFVIGAHVGDRIAVLRHLGARVVAVEPQPALVKGHVLSHDQIEAVLMRRAGYGVRVLAGEGSSFEQNPPTLVEFIRRDLRWCQGNMQYWHFLRIPGLPPVCRYHLAFAILMFLGSPAWIGLLLLGSAAVALAPTPADFMRWDAGIAVLVLVLAMWFAPNIATVVDVLTRAKLRRLFGGGARFSAGFMLTIIFVVLVTPIMWASHTLFLVRLVCGRTLDWGAQARHDHEVPWSLACRQFWPHTLIGLAPVLLLAVAAPAALPYALLIAAGPLLSIPLAVVTAAPALGRALIALGLDRLPEETLPPPELRALQLPAIEMSQSA